MHRWHITVLDMKNLIYPFLRSRKMNISPDVNFDELARSTDDFNGAQCKAVCVEVRIV